MILVHSILLLQAFDIVSFPLSCRLSKERRNKSIISFVQTFIHFSDHATVHMHDNELLSIKVKKAAS